MNNLSHVLFVMIFFLASLQAAEVFVAFTDLGQAVNEGEEVIIRGFLYQQPNGTLILAAQPNLKSCCVGNKESHPQQIRVQSQSALTPSSYAVSLKGILKKEPHDGSYVLDHAQLLQEHSYFGWIAIVGAVTLLVGFAFKRRWNESTPPYR